MHFVEVHDTSNARGYLKQQRSQVKLGAVNQHEDHAIQIESSPHDSVLDSGGVSEDVDDL